MSVQRDAVRMRLPLQGCAKDRFGRCYAARSTEIKLHGVALCIHGAVEIHQLPTNFDESLVGPPAPADRPLETSPALLACFRTRTTHRKIVVWAMVKPRSLRIWTRSRSELLETIGAGSI